VNQTAEIAYDLSPLVWGAGIGPAICASITDWAFANMDLVRIQATVLETNIRSIRVLEKCDFQREGYLRSFRKIRGTPGNFWMYSKLRSEPESGFPDSSSGRVAFSGQRVS
jgi:[ribosomal protein S5]-alanine N-acetyltransferase